jgi:hypothetical protein
VKSEAVTQESLGRSPISINLRSLGLYTEDLSRLVRHRPKATFALRATARPQYEGRATAKRRRGEGGRDSLKVAQYEVLGNDAKRQVRPGRDDRIAWRLLSHAAQRLPASLDRPRPGPRSCGLGETRPTCAAAIVLFNRARTYRETIPRPSPRAFPRESAKVFRTFLFPAGAPAEMPRLNP